MTNMPISAGTIAGVQHNCHISDAQYAGNYSLCVFLLKMREYYRWEQGLPQTATLAREQVGQWMTEREQLWEQLEDEDYQPLHIDGRHFDPFATTDINEALIPRGFVYSSGHGVFGKPHFMLARLRETRSDHGATVHICDQEVARDLVAPPAMSRDGEIFVRRQSLRRFLWEKIEEWQWKKNPHTPMGRVLSLLSGNPAPAKLNEALAATAQEALLDALTDQETDTLVLHEQGEILAGQTLGEDWQALLGRLDNPKGEFIMRAIRDLLADCLLTLPRLLDEGRTVALHFWFANFSGMRKALWPELQGCYDDCIKTGDFQALARLVADGRERWRQEAMQLLGLYRRGTPEALAHLETLSRCHNIS